jgi:hypothetical protein
MVPNEKLDNIVGAKFWLDSETEDRAEAKKEGETKDVVEGEATHSLLSVSTSFHVLHLEQDFPSLAGRLARRDTDGAPTNPNRRKGGRHGVDSDNLHQADGD